MFCKNCGKEVEDGAKFCRFCGENVAQEAASEQSNKSQPDILNSGLFQPVQNSTGSQQSSENAASNNGLFSSGLISAVERTDVQNSYDAPKQQDVSNPFGAKQASPAMQNPFGVQQPAVPAGRNPFESQQASPSAPQQNPFGGSANANAYKSEKVSQSPFGQPVPAASSGNELWNPEKDDKKAKKAKKVQKAKKEKIDDVEKGNKYSGAQTAKIVIMIVLQFIFIGVIAFLALTGKMSNDMGDINLGLTIGSFLIVLIVDAILYFILFAAKTTKNDLTPPPVFATHDTNSTPMYMNVSQNSSDAFAMGNVAKTDRDRILDNEDRFASKEAKPETNSAFGVNTYVQNNPVQVSEPAPAVQNNPAQVSEPVPAVQNPAIGLEDDGCELTQLMNMPAYDYADETTIINYPKLFFTENGVTKQVIINKAEFIIGRMAAKVDCVVTNRNIGRIHAAIISHDGNYYVKDFNSKNKTYINRGAPLSPEREYLLHNNDIISLADSEFVFKLPE